MKLCIDPGHGFANREAGVYDPGAVGSGLEEAVVVLVWAEELRRAVEARGIPVWMTRRDQVSATPLAGRASGAVANNCTHFISLHVNDLTKGVDEWPNGTETYYRDDKQFALEIQHCLLTGLGLKDRGVKFSNSLAVLKFPGSAGLIELGFIDNKKDVSAFTNDILIKHTCRMLAQIF